ncbi:hypothetical protein DMC25_27055 [Caulobacter sp. D4A]|uniref:hypothetical protein n=1 Tax=unclassified Caulobacter TaxID=2648921 RepID=UPI000D733EBD|nr:MULTISPECIES: hypothetical protein [unclassified Caulobacter]PXA70411.1 hypothetical protein DMC25_27055 [Caulobacter sp. D4A]PXA96816.1 hypothetical protein DMC18_00710 [Caulobacter sp. D5]
MADLDLQRLRAAIVNRVDTFETHGIRAALLDWALEDAAYEANDLGDALGAVQRRLETVDCAACAAPSGLIYDADLARRVPEWRTEIDEALTDYHDAVGQRPVIESVGGLVWFAVEWNASEMASILDRTRADILSALAA